MSTRLGWFRDVTVERYADRVMIGYRDDRRPAIGALGIELEDGRHAWPPEALQIAACDALGISRLLSDRVEVVDF